VIGVTATVVPDGRPRVLRDLVDVAEELVDGQLLERRIQLLHDGVQPVNVALVDPAVVELQCSSVDVGLERVVGIRQIGERVPGHQPLLFSKEYDNTAVSYCMFS
jgi:hypothetical protein